MAIDSLDHTQPNGTKTDNSSSPDFNRALYEIIPARDVRLLDIGCSGGGLVRSILDDGGLAVGIEGSDYSRLSRRAEWPTLDGIRLFTGDVTEPFELVRELGESGSDLQLFNIVTAWEFWEHIREDKIGAVCENIVKHMMPGAIFVGSICDRVEPHHQTCKPHQWWMDKFLEFGLKHSRWIEQHFERRRVRYEGFCVGMVRA